MKIDYNGTIREMNEEETAELHKDIPTVSYKQRVVNRIREIYSVDDELAILRQRDTKPEEFVEYDDFVEKIKREEKLK